MAHILVKRAGFVSRTCQRQQVECGLVRHYDGRTAQRSVLGPGARRILLREATQSVAMANPNKRPVFLNLLLIRQPPAAVLSIGHRISGVLMVLLLPLLIYLFDLSVRSPASYARLQSWFDSVPGKIFVVALAWMLAHHLLAGIRFLLLDVHVGVERTPARRSAWVVNIAGIVITLIVLGAVL